jgi:hypothetical protein
MTKDALQDAVNAANETPATPAQQIMEMTEQGRSATDATPTKHLHVLVKTQTVENLDRIAAANGIKRSFLINQILRDYVNGAFNTDGSISSMYLKAVSVS